MKKLFLLIVCCAACMGSFAQDKKISIRKASASSAEPSYEVARAIDGDKSTFWHTPWSSTATKFPVTLTITFKEATHVDYVRYIPRQDGNTNGNWQTVHVAYNASTSGNEFTSVGSYELNGSSSESKLWLTENGVTCGQVKFTIESGEGRFVSAAEVEAYAVDNTYRDMFAHYFTDDLFTELKPEVKSSEGVTDADLKKLIDNLLTDAEGYRKFRVGEYEPYLSTSTLQERLKTNSSYNNYENPTGVYLKAGESCLVVASGIDIQYPVGLTIKNWVENEQSSSYSINNGITRITASTEGNVFVKYYTDDFEIAPNVKVHFINAPVQGYWDQATMTNEDWVKLLEGRSKSDNTILITRSEHAQLAYPVSAWLTHCPTNVDSTMTLYQQTQWAQRDILGLEKYGRQVKNRQLFFATTYGFMAAGGEGAYCHVNSLGAIMAPDAAKFDFWGVGHEWGHNNQIYTGFKWSGCGETTNNIYASWGQIHFTGNPSYLRLEDEVTGVGEYSNMRGGRMQTYFEEGIRKGVAWQLMDGPDYHGIKADEKNVMGYDADGNYLGTVTTTSRNYDHFVKLSPFWQLNLWGTLAGKCPDIIPMVIESIRSTKNYTSYYGTNGKKQINWMKLACDSAKIDLLPFFEKAGMLRPINAYIEDYNAGWNIITEGMINDLKAYVKEQGYPAFTEEINYINGHNYHIYRDCLKLEVPKEVGEGCKVNGNKVTVQHSAVKNAVAYETYNSKGELIRITMYALGSDNNHSYTQVLYPTSKDENGAAYIMAVGYDGTRIKIYEQGGQRDEFFSLFDQAKAYAERIDNTGRKVGFLDPEKAADFIALIAKFDSLIETTDSRDRPYAQWSAELKEIIPTLVNYCVPMTPDRYYTLASYSDLTYYVGNTNKGLKVDSYQEEEKPISLDWKFVQTETEGVYNICHRTTGHYITAIEDGQRVKADSPNKADAIAFTIGVAAPGEVFIQSADDASIKLFYSNSYIYAGNQTSNAARWLVHMTDNQTEDSMLGMPEVSAGENLTVYYILDIDNGEYAYYKDFGRNDKGSISSKVYDTPSNLYFWFYFVEGSQEGKYAIYNYVSGLPVTVSNGLLYANKKADPAPEYTITLNEEGTGLIIATEEGAWNSTSQNWTKLNATNATNWKLQRIRTINTANEPLESIVLDYTAVTLAEGESVTLTATTAPVFATNHDIIWSSSNESVATVDANGVVNAIAKGSAIITATAADGSGISATCEVTVTEPAGISETQADMLIGHQGSLVIVSGLAMGTQVAVYDIMGRQIAATTATSVTAVIETNLPKGSIAIVKVEGYSYKLKL